MPRASRVTAGCTAAHDRDGLRRTLAAMSDDDDAPSAAAAATPKASRGWSEQDRRTLIIAVVGGLAANLGTVILVGAAIALVHLNTAEGAKDSALLTGTLVFIAFGLCMVALGAVARHLHVLSTFSGWSMIWTGWLMVLLAVMILIGLAAGVK